MGVAEPPPPPGLAWAWCCPLAASPPLPLLPSWVLESQRANLKGSQNHQWPSLSAGSQGGDDQGPRARGRGRFWSPSPRPFRQQNERRVGEGVSTGGLTSQDPVNLRGLGRHSLAFQEGVCPLCPLPGRALECPLTPAVLLVEIHHKDITGPVHGHAKVRPAVLSSSDMSPVAQCPQLHRSMGRFQSRGGGKRRSRLSPSL